MRVVVVGTGSIGTRHLKNLIELGHDVYAVDVNAEKLKPLEGVTKGVFTFLKDALRLNPKIAFICTFSNNHVGPAIECANAGCHLFIEKPLSLSVDGLNKLIKVVKAKRLITMVGCNMRFHPAISYVYDILSTHPAFEKKLWANLKFGYYLPFAKREYKSDYLANRSIGGGLLFDAIHELDYATWFFGEPSEVFCSKGILSELEIDTEDYADMLIKFKSGVSCIIHTCRLSSARLFKEM